MSIQLIIISLLAVPRQYSDEHENCFGYTGQNKQGTSKTQQENGRRPFRKMQLAQNQEGAIRDSAGNEKAQGANPQANCREPAGQIMDTARNHHGHNRACREPITEP